MNSVHNVPVDIEKDPEIFLKLPFNHLMIFFPVALGGLLFAFFFSGAAKLIYYLCYAIVVCSFYLGMLFLGKSRKGLLPHTIKGLKELGVRSGKEDFN